MKSKPPDSPLCSSCGLQPAHTFLTQIIDGVTTNSSLCDECARAQQMALDEDGLSIHDAKCFYCGDKAASGSRNQSWELPVRKLTMHYTCLRCMGLYHQFLLESLRSIPAHLPPEDQLRLMQTMAAEVDSRVRSTISE